MALMTVKEVAAMLRLSAASIYTMAQKGQIPAIKLGGSWRFERKTMEQFLASRNNLNQKGN